MKNMMYVAAYSGTIAGSGTATTDAINIERAENLGIHVDSVSGTAPSYDISYSVATSRDGTFITPSTGNIIINDASATDAIDFQPIPSKFIKLTITNNTGNALTISVKLCIQEG